MKYALGLIFLFLTACSSGQMESSVIDYPNDFKVYPASAQGNSIKRIYLMHGYGGDRTTYDQEPFATFRQSLQDEGFEVVTFTQPYATPAMLSDAGTRWRVAFTKYVSELIQQVEADYGQASINIAGGVSFGGLHALMLTEIMPEKFDAFFASKPVTHYNALTELFMTQTTHFNPFQNHEVLASKPGFIQWGTNDERVNYRLTIDLVNQVQTQNNDLTTVELVGEGHNSTPENLNNIVQWLQRF